MLKEHQLQTNRSALLDALYAASGRSCGTYTGLWQKFCHSLGVNMRDTDGTDIKADCIRAIAECKSVMPDKVASVCMEVFRARMMRGWE